MSPPTPSSAKAVTAASSGGRPKAATRSPGVLKSPSRPPKSHGTTRTGSSLTQQSVTQQTHTHTRTQTVSNVTSKPTAAGGAGSSSSHASVPPPPAPLAPTTPPGPPPTMARSPPGPVLARARPQSLNSALGPTSSGREGGGGRKTATGGGGRSPARGQGAARKTATPPASRTHSHKDAAAKVAGPTGEAVEPSIGDALQVGRATIGLVTATPPRRLIRLGAARPHVLHACCPFAPHRPTEHEEALGRRQQLSRHDAAPPLPSLSQPFRTAARRGALAQTRVGHLPTGSRRRRLVPRRGGDGPALCDGNIRSGGGVWRRVAHNCVHEDPQLPIPPR